MCTVKKKKQNPESYRPSEMPEAIRTVSESAKHRKYETYKNIEYRMDTVQLPETLKFAGVTSADHPDFENIGIFHDQYKTLLYDRYAPYTEIGFLGETEQGLDYLFGCQVDSLENLPEGLIGFDTGLKHFAVITFRAATAYELVGGKDGPGDAMFTAGEYLQKIWLPANLDKVHEVDIDNIYFYIKQDDKNYHMKMLEVYKVSLEDEAEMCFYIPLKS